MKLKEKLLFVELVYCRIRPFC